MKDNQNKGGLLWGWIIAGVVFISGFLNVGGCVSALQPTTDSTFVLPEKQEVTNEAPVSTGIVPRVDERSEVLRVSPSLTAPNGYYTNVDGNSVPRPYAAPSRPAGASARCRDGTYSFSQNRRGTCSHHGGVATWY